MLLHIQKVLTPTELARCRDLLASARWDMRVTRGHQSAKVKANLQLPQECAEARDAGAIVLKALERNAMFTSAALPRYIFRHYSTNTNMECRSGRMSIMPFVLFRGRTPNPH